MPGGRALLAVAVVALLLGGVDVVARSLVEGRIEDSARDNLPGTGSVDAEVRAFPFVPRLLASGSVPAVAVQAEQVPARGVQLASVEIDLRGVELNRDALVSGETEVESIDRGAVSVDLDAGSLSRALRVPVSIADGEVRAGTGRLTARVRPDVGRDGSLTLRVGGLGPLTVRLPRIRLLDCTAVRVAVVDDRLRLSCALDRVPDVVRRTVRQAPA
jgi:hypothetical protein